MDNTWQATARWAQDDTPSWLAVDIALDFLGYMRCILPCGLPRSYRGVRWRLPYTMGFGVVCREDCHGNSNGLGMLLTLSSNVRTCVSWVSYRFDHVATSTLPFHRCCPFWFSACVRCPSNTMHPTRLLADGSVVCLLRFFNRGTSSAV